MPGTYDAPIVQLNASCGHVVEYRKPAPTEGQQVYCRRCDQYRDVIGTVPQYHVRCLGCSYSRMFGQDLDTARAKGSRHVIKKEHEVFISLGGEHVETISQNGSQGELPFQSTVTERRQFTDKHQASLKNFQRSLSNRNPKIP